MSVIEAQAALRAIAFDLVRLEDRYREILASFSRLANEEAMFVGRIAWDLPTELLTTIECAVGSPPALGRIAGAGSTGE